MLMRQPTLSERTVQPNRNVCPVDNLLSTRRLFLFCNRKNLTTRHWHGILWTHFHALGIQKGETGFEIWFIKGRKGRPASGYIEDRLRYIRKQLFHDSKKKEETLKEEKRPEVEDQLGVLSEEEDAERVEWMKHQETGECREYMKETAWTRSKWIKGKTEEGGRRSVRDILTKYPHLLDSANVEQDFRITVSPTDNLLFVKWPALAKHVLCFPGDEWKKELHVDSIDISSLSEEEQVNLAFNRLPFIFRGRAKAMRGKCNVMDSLAAFIDFQLEGTDLNMFLTGIDVHKRLQPFILLLGGTQIKAIQVFVVVERRAITMTTLNKAVDYTFKLTYVLDLGYQPLLFAVWQFLEDVYELPKKFTGRETTATSIREFSFSCEL